MVIILSVGGQAVSIAKIDCSLRQEINDVVLMSGGECAGACEYELEGQRTG